VGITIRISDECYASWHGSSTVRDRSAFIAKAAARRHLQGFKWPDVVLDEGRDAAVSGLGGDRTKSTPAIADVVAGPARRECPVIRSAGDASLTG
jgi:hypothetical protein